MTRVIPIVIGTYYNAYSVIRGFGENGIKSILITHGENNFVQKSKYVKLVRVTRNVNQDEEGFIEDLLKLGRDIAPTKGVFFPTHDEHLLAIAKHKERLQIYFELPFSDYSTLKKIMDKKIFTSECEKLGIPTIRGYKVTTYEEAKEALRILGTPILVKIVKWDLKIIKAFGTKISVFVDPDNYLNSMKLFFEQLSDGELLVQEYIQDSDQLMPNVNSFTDREGNLRCIFVSEKVRQYPPQRGTSTATYSMNPEDIKYREIIGYSKRIAKAFRFYGLFGIEFKFDPKDKLYKIIEMNCRSEFPNYLQTLVGQNMALAIYKYHIGEQFTIPYYPLIKKATCVVPVLDYFYATLSNKFDYPNFVMSKKDWEESITEPITLYGLTKKDIMPYIFAYYYSWINAVSTLFRAKFNISESERTRDFIFRKLKEYKLFL